MRKHPLLALFTTTLTLTTTGAAGHAFASSTSSSSPRTASDARTTTRSAPSPIHAREDAVFLRGSDEPVSSTTRTSEPDGRAPRQGTAEPRAHGRDALARTAPRAIHRTANRRPDPGATAASVVRAFVRSDVSAAEPLALDLVLGSSTGRRLAASIARLHPSPVVRVLAAATLRGGAPRVEPLPHAGGPWLALRMCESGGNYAADTGNGYYGAYQFALSTWWWMGYSGMPDNAPPTVQDQAAERLMQRVGWSAWPVCSVTLGLR